MTAAEIAAAWKAAWESADPALVAALYRADATHQSGRVPMLWPELGRDQLRGVAEIQEYAQRAFANGRRLKFEIIHVLEGRDAVAVEYWSENSLAPGRRARVMESFELTGGRISAARVFHSGSH